MTHTLNRTGLASPESSNEFIFLCMIPAAWKGTKTAEMVEICDILLKHKPDNMIGIPAGLDEEGLRKMAANATILTAAFNNPVSIQNAVKEVKDKNLGVSIVLSGLFDGINTLCSNIGACEHTHNISLGVFGKADRLPDESVLEITTQCGHALISSLYVEHVVKSIKKGKLTCEEGMKMLVKPCVCGIANPKRIKNSLEKMT
ncbi:MAG: hypothetical protein FP816_13340 [Desulfobacteraceae bacterium]|nr:hypothetical protein [Desulfobacteraceae bacterium]MBU4055023.1 hypothetical protein [Pseudomonadota bacterium]